MKNFIRSILTFLFPRCNSYDPTLERSIFHLRRYIEQKNNVYRDYNQAAVNWENRTSKISTEPQNVSKNRYTNILPYDQTIVTLNSGEYINANYVYTYLDVTSDRHLSDTSKILKSKTEEKNVESNDSEKNQETQANSNNNDPIKDKTVQYICTQGPMAESTKNDDTIGDFWEMVIQENSKLVVMVTQLMQGNRIKCSQYWPENGEKSVYKSGIGEITVETLSEIQKHEGAYIWREFKVSYGDEMETTVQHLQYVSWPDHGVPTKMPDFLAFVSELADIRSKIDLAEECQRPVTTSLKNVKTFITGIFSIKSAVLPFFS